MVPSGATSKSAFMAPPYALPLTPLTTGTGVPDDLRVFGIERDREQHAVPCVDDVAGLQVPGVSASFPNAPPLACVESDDADGTRSCRPDRCLMVNSAALPPGSMLGKAWLPSFCAAFGCVSSVGGPPPDAMRHSPAFGRGQKRIDPSGAHVAPRGSRVVASSVGVLPSTTFPEARGSFHSLLSRKKPRDLPSGDRNGCEAFSVPVSGQVSDVAT